MNTNSFIVYITTDYVFKNVGERVKIRFETSNYELDSALPKGKSKKSF